MSLQFRSALRESKHKYFLYLRRGQIAKTIFVEHPILSAVALYLAYRYVKKAGIKFGDLKKLGGRLLQIHKRINALVVEFKETLTPDQLQWINDHLHVDIEPVRTVTACLDTAVIRSGVSETWNNTPYTGLGIKVAVVDTGINDSHPDLAGRVMARRDHTKSSYSTTKFNFSDFLEKLGYKKTKPVRLDPVGHGTHCAGAVGGNGSIYRGPAYKCTFIDSRVLGDNGSGTTDGVVKGMSWAAQQGADIISMSLGGPGNPDDAISREANALAEDGIVVVVAAGNEGPKTGTIGSPGCSEKVITVAATDKSDKITSYSSRGPVIDRFGKDLDKPDVSCTGGGTQNSWCPYESGIISAKSADTPVGKCTVSNAGTKTNYEKMSGTSMATPHVSGICALMLEASGLTKDQKNRCSVLKVALKATAKNLGYHRHEQGAGLVSALAAINKLKS